MKFNFCSKEILVCTLLFQISRYPVCVAITHGFARASSTANAGIYPLEYITGILIGFWSINDFHTFPSCPGALRFFSEPDTPTLTSVLLVISISVFKR